MNKKGIVFLYLLMLGLTIIVLGLAFASPIKEFVDSARTSMSCGSGGLSIYDDATCEALDLLKPLITGGIILIGFAVLGAKIIWG